MLRRRVLYHNGGICAVVVHPRNTSGDDQRYPIVCALNDMDVDRASHRCMASATGFGLTATPNVWRRRRTLHRRVSAATAGVPVVIVALKCTSVSITILRPHSKCSRGCNATVRQCLFLFRFHATPTLHLSLRHHRLPLLRHHGRRRRPPSDRLISTSLSYKSMSTLKRRPTPTRSTDAAHLRRPSTRRLVRVPPRYSNLQ